MTGYIVEFGWFPDDAYVNTLTEPEYLGYWLGDSIDGTQALWTFEEAVETPSVALVDLLPDDYEEIELDAEITKYGFKRIYLPSTNIGDALESITTAATELVS